MPLVGIVSDIHEDIECLRRALAALDARGCDEIVCVGDSVGFAVPYFAHFGTRDARAVLELLRDRCALVLAGNHDLFAVRKLPEHRAGVDYPEEWYELPYFERERLMRGKVYLYEREELPALLGHEDRAYLRGLPEVAVRDYPGLRVLFSHYAFPDLTGSRVFEARTAGDAAAHLAFTEQHGCTLGISGHDHFEGLRVFTAEGVQDLPFGAVRLDRKPTWMNGPAVVNGTYANGALVLDTDKLEVEAIPLNSVKHQIPSWKGEWKG